MDSITKTHFYLQIERTAACELSMGRGSTSSRASDTISIRSFRSSTSKLSVQSGRQDAIQAIDRSVQESFEKRDHKYLINLLGIGDTVCGFLRLGCTECIEDFLLVRKGWMPYPDESIKALALQNWPHEWKQMQSVLITTRVRLQLRPIIKEHDDDPVITEEVIKKLILAASPELSTSAERAEVFVLAECCRLQHQKALFALLKYTCNSMYAINVLHIRFAASDV